MSEHQPIDLDDLQRVGVLVREKTDDNWLADMVELAHDEIARLRGERRWVSVGERLPDEDEQVLWLLNDNATIDLDYTKPFNATHWKPKPLPPGPEGDG